MIRYSKKHANIDGTCYNHGMDRKQIFLLSLLTIIALVLTTGAFYEQQHHAVKVDAAVQKAQAQRDSAVSEVKALEDSTDLNLKSANAEVQDQSTVIAALCVQVKTAKLTSPYCH